MENLKIKKIADIGKLKVAICGDVINSRVARSNVELLSKFGAQVNLIAPVTLLPKYNSQKNVKCFDNLELGLKGVDVIITLRIQRERMKNSFALTAKEYFKLYGITRDSIKFAKEGAIILHPGPVNRDVEICTKLVDDEKICMILKQVRNGVAIRQALLRMM
jgi:aspartate carbamoyltransferase catalytic subunit